MLAPVEATEDTAKSHKNSSVKRKMGVPSFLEPEASNEKVSSSKSGKKISSRKESQRKKNLLTIIQKAKHAFIEH